VLRLLGNVSFSVLSTIDNAKYSEQGNLTPCTGTAAGRNHVIKI